MRYFMSMLAITAALIVLINIPPVFGKDLRTEEVKTSDIAGTFTLILYGGNYVKDIKTAAFLDLEGDQYTFEPYAPAFDYRVIRGLSAKEALETAELFVSATYSFRGSQSSRIIDDSGRTVGYEIRPLYEPLTFGTSDVMNIDYVTKGNKIRIYINLKPRVEREILDGGNSRDSAR